MYCEALAMRNQNASLKSDNHNNGLTALVQKLLREPYAVEQGFGDSTIDGLNKLLEEAAEEMEQPNLPADMQKHAKSYGRCKEIYCEILMELELQNVSPMPKETLAELAVGMSDHGEPPPMRPTTPTADTIDIDDAI